MRFLHISDLHIGKVVNDFSMLEDQRFILEQIAGMAAANKVDAVVIAGDIYDRAIPTGDAVALLDAFLNQLHKQGIQTIMISGNHDSPERISFGENLLRPQGVHIAGTKKESLTRVEFETEGYKTDFVLLPFCKPAQLGVRTTQEAAALLLERYWQEEKELQGEKSWQKDGQKNRVLVTHFFVTDQGREPELSDSETTIHVGGLDNVDASLMEGFDYVALGHIHKSQQIGDRPIWYAGSPLKYSFGELGQTKNALLVTLGETGLQEIKRLPLRPMRELRRVKGTLKEILEDPDEGEVKRSDYIQAVLTDKGELIDPIGALRSRYPNVMQILREEKSEVSTSAAMDVKKSRTLADRKDARGLFEAFYQDVQGQELSREGKDVIIDIVKELEEKQK